MNTAAILAIVQKLSLDADFKAALGKKIIALWLKYKIFETLDILRGTEENKRKTVINIIEGFKFAGSSLQGLLRACITAIQGNLEELNDMKDMIVEGGREEEVNQLFEA
jgi:hypothetical protein